MTAKTKITARVSKFGSIHPWVFPVRMWGSVGFIIVDLVSFVSLRNQFRSLHPNSMTACGLYLFIDIHKTYSVFIHVLIFEK